MSWVVASKRLVVEGAMFKFFDSGTLVRGPSWLVGRGVLFDGYL